MNNLIINKILYSNCNMKKKSNFKLYNNYRNQYKYIQINKKKLLLKFNKNKENIRKRKKMIFLINIHQRKKKVKVVWVHNQIFLKRELRKIKKMR